MPLGRLNQSVARQPPRNCHRWSVATDGLGLRAIRQAAVIRGRRSRGFMPSPRKTALWLHRPAGCANPILSEGGDPFGGWAGPGVRGIVRGMKARLALLASLSLLALPAPAAQRWWTYIEAAVTPTGWACLQRPTARARSPVGPRWPVAPRRCRRWRRTKSPGQCPGRCRVADAWRCQPHALQCQRAMAGRARIGQLCHRPDGGQGLAAPATADPGQRAGRGRATRPPAAKTAAA